MYRHIRSTRLGFHYRPSAQAMLILPTTHDSVLFAHVYHIHHHDPVKNHIPKLWYPNTSSVWLAISYWSHTRIHHFCTYMIQDLFSRMGQRLGVVMI
jgi:hypothetical protein